MEFLFVYALGALGYGAIEALWRGYTHWSMLLLGGLCFRMIYRVTAMLPRWRLWQRCLLCTLGITALELLTGCVVNLGLGWEVWDYRGVPGNLLGQICPLYAALWYLLTLPCSLLAGAIHSCLFHRPAGPEMDSG